MSKQKDQKELSLRVYYEDTDATGVVYHASYLKFMERARTEWLRYLGFAQSALAKNNDLNFVVASLNLDYRRPVYLDEKIVVRTKIVTIGRVSLELKQQILNQSKDVVCEGYIRLGCIDVLSRRLKRIPQEMKRRLL